MTEKLRPCPFCGGCAEVKDWDGGRQAYTWCPRCRQAETEPSYGSGYRYDWNTRPIEDELIGALKDAVILLSEDEYAIEAYPYWMDLIRKYENPNAEVLDVEDLLGDSDD